MPQLALLAMLGSLLAASADERLERLPEERRQWLEEEVVYIISEVEREAFLNLRSEEERDAFVEAFWRKRDENPSTPENEYKIRHYERLEYANEFFGRDTFREGWRTDMGRYWILLGEPRSRHNFEGKDEVYPSELWFYNDPDLKRYNLPPFFRLLFFRRHGVGEFELYNPIADGPQTLLTRVNTVSMDFRDDVERAYMELMFIDPELAAASLSFRTDEGDTAQFQAPSFGTLELIDDIITSPFVRLDTSYAERLDFERGSVESDYMFTFVPSEGMMSVLPGPGGAAYLHWAVELDPQNVAFVEDARSGYLTSSFIATIEVVPRDDPDTLVLQDRRESFVRLHPDDRSALHRPFSYTGMTPLVPGDYDVRIILRNRACPSRDETACLKSYTLLDGGVRVPDWPEDRAVLGDLVIGHGRELRSGDPVYRAYRFGNLEVHPAPAGVYAIDDTLVVAIEPVGAPEGSSMRFRLTSTEVGADGTPALDETVPLSAARGPVVQELLLEGFQGGRYDLSATLVGPSGRELDSRSAPIVVSPRTSIARPAARGTMPQMALEIPGVLEMTLGEQLLALGRTEEARARFEAGLAQNPKLGPAREYLARFAMEEGDFGRVVELLAPLYEEVKDRYEVISLLGQAYFRLGRYAESAELLEKAVVLRRPPVSLLNMLANASYEAGNLERAIELLRRSLETDPDQSGIAELIERLEAEKGATPEG